MTFIGGVLDLSGAFSGNLTRAGTTNKNIGLSAGDNSHPFRGWLDDYRITKGVARYTAGFTPPTAAFPDS